MFDGSNEFFVLYFAYKETKQKALWLFVEVLWFVFVLYVILKLKAPTLISIFSPERSIFLKFSGKLCSELSTSQ